MARLIDADKLLERMEKRLNNLRKEFGNYDHYTDGFDEGCVAVEDAADIDAIDVVRCKDCKYYEIHRPKVMLCCERNGKLIPMFPDDFCSYGEAIENE